MASRYFDSKRNRWLVRWFRAEDGKRVTAPFLTEQEARSFVPSDEHRAGARGPEPILWASPENIRARIQVDSEADADGCWIWQIKGGTSGYPQATERVDGKVVTHLMHRVSYEVFVGPIADGMTIDHLCGVTMCVNPEHLEPVTLAENIRRRDERKAVSA